ncbi:hypothetical protein [Oceaniglobus indicus]|uniref:hypothetical protein n=1 Tax=Oceaniglobus indicus TaxID=2047749 RepID=UPI001F4DB9DC|nr:hypothetical protein [Oceaniglobus indicus]
MKNLLTIAAVALCAASFAPTTVSAGTIERACLKSDRRAATRSTCGCIQQVADLTLDRRDQRMAARFFRDPHRAQEVRQSSRSNDEQFWRRYKQFGSTAEAYCS